MSLLDYFGAHLLSVAAPHVGTLYPTEMYTRVPAFNIVLDSLLEKTIFLFLLR